MSAGPKKESLLSSWKEIAVYLDCNERTCRRWEKEFDLPVHRFEAKQKYRVYAYKDELDQWLKTLFNNNSVLRKDKKNSLIRRISLFILIPIIAISLVYFILIKERSSPKNPGSPGIPQSTGPLTLHDNDLVTTEFHAAGRLRVWRKNSSNVYEEAWRIEPIRHSSVAVGNVDNKRDCEIVAPGVCRVTEERGDRIEHSYKFFLNIYKQGVKDWWKTTFYSDADCIFEKKNWGISEIAIADVDGEPGNEVVLITMSCLAIFKYDTEENEFKLLRSRQSFFEEIPLFLKSIAVGNIDNDKAEEIIVACDERTELGTAFNKGWILILKFQNDWPTITKAIQVDANLAFQSLRLGDVIEGGFPEIVIPSYRGTSGMWNTYIMGWNSIGEKIFEKQVYDMGDQQNRIAYMDIGNISPKRGEEIVVANTSLRELIYYYWDGTNLIEDSRSPLSYRNVIPSNIYIIDSDNKVDSFGEILVCGRSLATANTGRFFLGVLGYNKGFFSIWNRLGGERGERPVSYAAIGKKKE